MCVRNLGNIYLVGFMGAGKTTVGQILAQRLSRAFYDTDQMIERECGKSVAEIFHASGEAHFRELETEVILTLAKNLEAVVALGGGAILKRKNRRHIRSTGLSVYLRWRFDSLMKRLQTCNERPLLSSPVAAVHLYKEREALYETADHWISCSQEQSPEQIADQVTKVAKTR